jgi:16S rRNA (adenine(1408)-N(1))-methyltransferase
MIDLGTGDGAAVIEAARRDPATLAIGIDADASRMREASARSARSPRRGGLPNALFLVGDAASLPAAFDGVADEVAITLPWGSLLRAVLAADRRFATGLGRVLRPGGRVRVVVSLEDRDRAAFDAGTIDAGTIDPELRAFGACLEAVGLELVERRAVVAADMATIRSSWARRLGIPARRGAWMLAARRLEPAPGRPQEPRAPAIAAATSRMSDS